MARFSVFSRDSGMRLGDFRVEGGEITVLAGGADGSEFPAALLSGLRDMAARGSAHVVRDYFTSLSSLHAGLIAREVLE